MHESSLSAGYWRGNTCAATLARRRCRVIAAPVQHKEAGWGQRSRSLSEREFSCRGSRALRRAGNALGFHRPTGPPRRPWRPSVARNTARRNVLQRGRASPFTTGPSGLQKPVYVLPRRPAVRRSKIAELMYTRQRGTAIEARCGVPCPNPRSALAPAQRKETKIGPNAAARPFSTARVALPSRADTGCTATDGRDSLGRGAPCPTSWANEALCFSRPSAVAFSIRR